MRQAWCDLLFAHWPIPATVLRPLVPSRLEVQEFDGTSWVGVVPFRMEGVAPRFCPELPGLSAFPEVNLRLYVEEGGKPGVWFLSLDATNSIAVWIARRFFHLPYYKAEISISGLPRQANYRSTRTEPPAGIDFVARYEPSGTVYEAKPGSLEHWLTERYCLYAQTPSGRLLRTEVHHRPWPLEPAKVHIERNHLTEPHGFQLQGAPTLTHFSRRIEVVNWRPELVPE
jgi:uncharacterized protein YqjF (DUF2071 family)